MVVVACSGCNEEITVQDDKMKHLKIHMVSAHNFNDSIESHAYMAFLSKEEKVNFSHLLKPRLDSFLEGGRVDVIFTDMAALEEMKIRQQERNKKTNVDENSRVDECDNGFHNRRHVILLCMYIVV